MSEGLSGADEAGDRVALGDHKNFVYYPKDKGQSLMCFKPGSE